MCQDPEPALDLIEPGRIGWREVKMEARVACQPRPGPGMLVWPVVINHEMHIEPGWNVGIDLFQKAKEIPGAGGAPCTGS